MNVRTVEAEIVQIELEPWEARRILMALERMIRARTVGKSEFSMSEKVALRKLLNGLREN